MLREHSIAKLRRYVECMYGRPVMSGKFEWLSNSGTKLAPDIWPLSSKLFFQRGRQRPACGRVFMRRATADMLL